MVASYAQESNERYPEHPAHYKLNYLLARVAISRADFRHSRELLQIVLADPQAMETKTAAMAQWLIGESYFHQDNLEQALMAYQLVDATYDYPEWRAPRPTANYQNASKGWDIPNWASKTLQRLLKDFPDTDAAKQAASIESAPYPSATSIDAPLFRINWIRQYSPQNTTKLPCLRVKLTCGPSLAFPVFCGIWQRQIR